MIKIEIEKVTDLSLANELAEFTTHGKKVNATILDWAKSEHSPLRCLIYKVKLYNIPTFVSTHLVRHFLGVVHFVTSNRDDRGGTGDNVINRLTPVNHAMLINAQAVIAVSRKRLCFKSAKKTVAVWLKVKKAFRKAEPELEPFLVPECVYRNGLCPEFKECKPGLEKVLKAYPDYKKLFEKKAIGINKAGKE